MTTPTPARSTATNDPIAYLPNRRRWIDDLIEVSNRSAVSDSMCDPFSDPVSDPVADIEGNKIPAATLRDIQADGEHTLAALIRLEAALLRLAAKKPGGGRTDLEPGPH